MTLTYLKELELENEQENDADEYLDAFVALGGQPDKDGFVSKENLIQIIKAEFELTIDMEEFLRKIGGNSEEINSEPSGKMSAPNFIVGSAET